MPNPKHKLALLHLRALYSKTRRETIQDIAERVGINTFDAEAYLNDANNIFDDPDVTWEDGHLQGIELAIQELTK